MLRFLVAAMLLLAACGPATTPAAPTAAPAAPQPTTPPAAAAAQPTPVAAAGQGTAPTAVAAPPTPPADAASQPKRGGILKVGLQADPTSLDPQKTSLTALFHVTEHIYGLLVRLNPDLTAAPDLAEKWDISTDGLKYTFALRKG